MVIYDGDVLLDVVSFAAFYFADDPAKICRVCVCVCEFVVCSLIFASGTSSFNVMNYGWPTWSHYVSEIDL